MPDTGDTKISVVSIEDCNAAAKLMRELVLCRNTVIVEIVFAENVSPPFP